MWVERVPRPPDFCGRVGCPICYAWGDPSPEAEVRALFVFAEGLLGRQPTQKEMPKICKAAKDFHAGAATKSILPEELPPDPSLAKHEELLKDIAKAHKTRPLTIDEIADRKQVAQEIDKAKKEQVREAVRLAQEFEQEQKAQKERERQTAAGVRARDEYMRMVSEKMLKGTFTFPIMRGDDPWNFAVDPGYPKPTFYSWEEVVEQVDRTVKRVGTAPVKRVLDNMRVERVADLKTDQYGAFLAEMQRLQK